MSPSDNPHILVVDDFHDNLLLISMFFESENYQVEAAQNGKEALEKIELSPPDLVLMDVRLPDISGIEVAQQLRQNPQFVSLPIILLTGDLEISFEEVSKLGVNGLFHKPIDLVALLEQVKVACCATSISQT